MHKGALSHTHHLKILPPTQKSGSVALARPTPYKKQEISLPSLCGEKIFVAVLFFSS
jgi:hypothetical protein